MYEYIKGKIIELTPSFVIIETAEIGYFIKISLNSYSQISDKSEIKLFLHQILREDTNDLFGFFLKVEREIFRLLISVSGIGANTARLMLSSLKPEEIKTAILTNDVSTIKSVKGIGVKTAQRVIIDLKDKIDKIGATDIDILPLDNTNKQEAISALVMLGFTKKSAEKAVNKIIKTENNLTVEDIVKKSLKSLS